MHAPSNRLPPYPLMLSAISPYDVASGSPAAFAALAISRRVVTLLPAPLEGTSPAEIRSAIDRSPLFRDLMESWRWTQPLWHSGLLASSHAGHHPFDDARAVSELIADSTDPALATLQPFMHASTFRETHAYLDALCRDLLRPGAGADPAALIPVSAAMDRFAARCSLAVFKAASPSSSGRLERRFAGRDASPMCRFSLPVLQVRSGDAILAMRDTIASELDALSDALDAIFSVARAGNSPSASSVSASLDPALDRFQRAFHAALPRVLDFAAAGDFLPSARRTASPAATLSLTASLAPADAILQAAARAAWQLRPKPDRNIPSPSPAQTPDSVAELSFPRVLTLIAKQLPWDEPSHDRELPRTRLTK